MVTYIKNGSMYQKVCSKIRVKRWPLTNTPEADLASFETGELQEESSQTHNSFPCALQILLLPPGHRGLFAVHKKSMGSKGMLRQLPPGPQVFFTLCASGRLHHTATPVHP